MFDNDFAIYRYGRNRDRAIERRLMRCLSALKKVVG